MRLRSPRLWLAIVSSAAVLYVTVGYVTRPSPGPLAAVHEREPKLTGFGSCANCHGGWFSDMTAACLDCHKDIGGQLESRVGLHGILDPAMAPQCARCHSDHHGEEFAMVNKLSFTEAGIAERDRFDHETIGYVMLGKHLELTCDKCHKNADVAVLPEGEKRFLGLSQECATCHEDVHKGQMGQTCVQCHGQESWTKLHSEGHEKRLALVGGHGDIACRTCHAQEDPLHSLEAIGRGTWLYPRECRVCHESPHDEAFLVAAADLVARPPGAGCIECHLPEHTAFRQEGVTTTPEQHACSGFPLVKPHDTQACTDCHGRGEDFAARYPKRKAEDCEACHEDVHGGQFASGPFAAQGCVGCHEREWWEPHAFTVDRHARAALPLTGAHREVECTEGHKQPGEESPRVFHGTPARCEGCHDDAHRDFFARAERELKRDRAGTCAVCHLTTTFREVPPEGFDHGKWTAFPLEAAHAQSSCESCHKRTEKPDATGRTFGFVQEVYGKLIGCVTCHKDPHGGEFDKPGLPREVNGRTGCARCHTEASFRAFPEEFAHGKWTGFVLDGAHGKVSCASCHAPQRKPDRFGRTWGRAKGGRCVDCHTDPHAGQFLIGGVIDCARCHKSTTFKDLSFRHNFDSRFPLGKAHANVACDECHKPTRIGNVEVVRYRPLGRECADCHSADPLKRPPKGRDR
jgi:hypothetical protein